MEELKISKQEAGYIVKLLLNAEIKMTGVDALNLHEIVVKLSNFVNGTTPVQEVETVEENDEKEQPTDN